MGADNQQERLETPKSRDYTPMRILKLMFEFIIDVIVWPFGW
jgi:hypothetical protein